MRMYEKHLERKRLNFRSKLQHRIDSAMDKALADLHIITKFPENKNFACVTHTDGKLNPLERLKPFAAIFFPRLAYSLRPLFKLKIYNENKFKTKKAHFDMHHSNEKKAALRYKYSSVNNMHCRMAGSNYI